MWEWFFNEFHERQFSREACVNAFLEHVAERASNKPSEAVAQTRHRLRSAGVRHALGWRITTDPEDASVCPLRELGLVVRHSDVHRFEKGHPLDAVPVEAFIACASKTRRRNPGLGQRALYRSAARSRNGPARVLGLRGDQLEDMAEAATSVYGGQGVQISLLGAERYLVIPEPRPTEWFEAHFRRIGRAAA